MNGHGQEECRTLRFDGTRATLQGKFATRGTSELTIHDHLTGLPRGLACPGNQGCNALMPSQLTLERARLIVSYLERVENYYRESVASLYGISPERIFQFVEYRPGNAIKISIRREFSSGDVGESDVYGCQQYIPLLDIPIPWDDDMPEPGAA